MASIQSESQADALLLLTNTPPSSFQALKTAYSPILATILSELSASVNRTDKTAVLEIAIAIGGLPEVKRPYSHLQQLIASFYRLLGTVSSSLSVELDTPGGVDARLFFLVCDSTTIEHLSYGPIIDIRSLASSKRRWNTVFTLDTEEGHGLARNLFDGSTPQPKDIRFLPSVPNSPANCAVNNDELSTPSYSVVVGGTFDHLHAGHKLLLTATALALDARTSPSPLGRRILTIGITGDELLVNKKYAEFLESWETRWKGVWDFFQSILVFSSPDQKDIRFEHQSKPGPNGNRVIVTVSPDLELRFVQIADPFGPTITDEEIMALVVSEETRSGGAAVNGERAKKGWQTLEVFEVGVLEAGDDGQQDQTTASQNFESKISSTEIRRRRMNLAKGNL
ncbi:hypothetical protein FQN57_007038 [Myotisia sp. PD_48]|nr:hypothetical protein FQN57_007038 [Myotisia sp. PD_48]